MARPSGTSAVSTARPSIDNVAVAELRRAAGLSRERLAAKAGVSVRTIYALEVEGVCPRRATQQVLAEALGVAASDLFPTNEQPVVSPSAPRSSAERG